MTGFSIKNVAANTTNGISGGSITPSRVNQNENTNIHEIAKNEQQDLPATANPIDIDSLSEEDLQLFQDINQLMSEYQDPAELLEAAEELGYSQSDIEAVFGAPSDEAGPLVEGDPQTEEEANMPPADIDPETYAQQYADEHGLELEEAKAELFTKYGDPQAPDADTSIQGQSTDTTAVADTTEEAKTLSTEDKEALIEAGVEESIISKGKEAVGRFFIDNMDVPDYIVEQGLEAVLSYLKADTEE